MSEGEQRRGGMKMILGILLALFVSSGADAAIFWDDEMEPGNTGYAIVSGAMLYDTAVKVSGTASVRYDYPSMCLSDCGGFMDRSFPATMDKWTRFYIRLSNDFIVGPNTTKIMRTDTNGIQSTWWVMYWGTTNYGGAVQNVPPGDTANIYSSFSFPPGQWHCVEMHERLNTPGANNGVMEAWVDGTSVLSRSDLMYRAAGDNSLYHNNRMYRQNGQGNIWYDRVAVGDQRIGCNGSPPNNDTTPPSQPTGLLIR